MRHMGMWTKLRPGAVRLLAAAAARFELYIYTMGNREYAYQMASLLDPSGKLLQARRLAARRGPREPDEACERPDRGRAQARIISAGDSTTAGVKDLDVILGSDDMVLILDDTERVWPRHRQVAGGARADGVRRVGALRRACACAQAQPAAG